ncbi:hypothetical protein [Synechococcus sp. KORDI-100]|uniref:hypothetical protein n=1 Tax=Synechococcus sp. KORDI-100 TaxID=1280380 RepID=UPI0012DFF85D|nr:hypothetical protein [Synechococcus sp. KORDI-100]
MSAVEPWCVVKGHIDGCPFIPMADPGRRALGMHLTPSLLGSQSSVGRCIALDGPSESPSNG